MGYLSTANGAAIPIDKRLFSWTLGLLVLQLPAIGTVLAIVSNQSVFFWALPIAWCVALPLLDRSLGANDDSSSESKETRTTLSFLAALSIPLFFVSLLCVAISLAGYSAAWYELLGVGIGLGIVASHLLLLSHAFAYSERSFEGTLCFLSVAFVGWGHYRYVSHVLHQRGAATPSDYYSARMGESLYRFALRSWLGASAATMQRLRHSGNKRGWWVAVRHDGAVMSLMFVVPLYAALTMLGGYSMALVLLLMWASATCIYTAILYIQHYGLLRRKRADGEYERLQTEHAWEEPGCFSSCVLFGHGRHADRHLHPLIDAPSLRISPMAPKLPAGYPESILLAFVPMWWFSRMDEYVSLWADLDLHRVNLDGEAYERLMARYHRPT